MVVADQSLVKLWKRESFPLSPSLSHGRGLMGISTAVAAVISLLSIFTASLGLHIRLKQASAHWKEEASMNRRRSMMSTLDNPMASVTASVAVEPKLERGGSKRWSNVPEYTMHGQERSSGSIAKHDDNEEERLGSQLDLTRNSAREQETMIRRAS